MQLDRRAGDGAAAVLVGGQHGRDGPQCHDRIRGVEHHQVGRATDGHISRQPDVLIGGRPWQVWTATGGDYVVGRTVKATGRPAESYLVNGSAPDGVIRDFAATLEPDPQGG